MTTMPSRPSLSAFFAHASTVESTPSPSSPLSTRVFTSDWSAVKRSGASGTRNSPSGSAHDATISWRATDASSIRSSALSTTTESVDARLSASAARRAFSASSASSQSSAMRKKNCGLPTVRSTASLRTLLGSSKIAVSASSYIRLSIRSVSLEGGPAGRLTACAWRAWRGATSVGTNAFAQPSASAATTDSVDGRIIMTCAGAQSFKNA
mmetsp:Transcript_9710/g.30045  ORF Transcript_9710/g.30045 Transcript_9710/m.30045 type:complete len:210 (+) Transcript_9710:486-1115(+)